MQNPRLIKKRVGSIKNIFKITKALEMVAASRVQSAQNKALSSKAFAGKIYNLVQSFSPDTDAKAVPLLRQPIMVKNVLFVLTTTNRGLCGSLNTNLFRYFDNYLKKNKDKNSIFITLGKKGRSFALVKGKLSADFSENNSFYDAIPFFVKSVIDSFTSGQVDEVNFVYNDFVSALKQEPTIKKVLPVTTSEMIEEIKKHVDFKSESMKLNVKPKYVFEPGPAEVLSTLLPFYLEIEAREMIYEAEASEHSARMIAMKNASDNADQLSYNLNLEYNNARQQLITNELADIVTAGVSLEK